MNYCIHPDIVRQVDMRVDNSIIPDSDSGHDTNMNTCAAVITDECAQFVPAGIDHCISDFYLNFFCIEPPVCGNRTCAKRTPCADDRITCIIHVKLRAVTYIGFLDFGTKTDHTIGAEMAITSDQCAIADNRIPPDINRSSDHCIL